ncbi:MAG: peptide-methionine (S)-S-oxide reductase MsrA [Clostridia bacterium]|nr:peptide-methionine (S)-S-oxide reductase MsrA [Clostridia bacterium]
MDYAYFAGGCFWCIAPLFADIPGVKGIASGYSGGDEENPTYSDVKRQLTGHRETVRLEYDEHEVSFEELLNVFLSCINPFDGGGQFIDRGHSYTCAVYYTRQAEADSARRALSELEKNTGRAACVSIEQFKTFYTAEEYHQDYWKKHPEEFMHEITSSGRMDAACPYSARIKHILSSGKEA